MNGTAADRIPFLPRGVWVKFDTIRNCSVLLGPERALILDPISVAILETTDGVRTIAQICANLAETYQAPLDLITKDTNAFLTDLYNKRFLEYRDA